MSLFIIDWHINFSPFYRPVEMLPFFAQFLRSLERSVKHLSGLRMNAQEMKIRKNPVIAKEKVRSYAV